MVGLLNIAYLKRTVKVGETDVNIVGITAKGLASLIDRFPEVRKMLSDRGANLTAEGILKLAPSIVSAFLAAGIGHPGNEEAETEMSDLYLGDQLNLVTGILEVTFPQGVRPFVERLQGLGLLSIASDDTGKTPDMKLESS